MVRAGHRARWAPQSRSMGGMTSERPARDMDRDVAGTPTNAAEDDPDLDELSEQEGEVRAAPAGPADDPTDGAEPLNPA